MIKQISFIGLSHLSLVHASVYSKYAKKIVCYDNDEILISNLKNFEINLEEPKLKLLLKKNKKKILYTSQILDIIDSDIVYVGIDIATNTKNQLKLDKLNFLCKQILKLKLKKKTSIVFLSQVPPGFTENFSKKIKNKVFYQVETLVFGNAIKRAESPERLIVGSKYSIIDDSKYFNLLKKFKCPILNMDYRTSELSKIAINIMLISTAMTANYLSFISEKLNFNWIKIIEALKMDRRIGKYAYLYPSLGLSGGNLERDLNSLKQIANKNLFDTSIIKSWNKISILRKKWIQNQLLNIFKKVSQKQIFIFGLSYKENTNSIKNSNSIEIIKKFKDLNFYGYDPKVKSIQIKNFKFMNLDKKILKEFKIYIIFNKSEEFKNFFKKHQKDIKDKYILDPYNILENMNLSKLNKVISLGKHNEK